MASWKGYSRHQKIQVGILYVIWGLFGLVVTILYVGNVISLMEYVYGIIAWALLAAALAVVTWWFILRKKMERYRKAA